MEDRNQYHSEFVQAEFEFGTPVSRPRYVEEVQYRNDRLCVGQESYMATGLRNLASVAGTCLTTMTKSIKNVTMGIAKSLWGLVAELHELYTYTPTTEDLGFGPARRLAYA